MGPGYLRQIKSRVIISTDPDRDTLKDSTAKLSQVCPKITKITFGALSFGLETLRARLTEFKVDRESCCCVFLLRIKII